MLATNSPDFHVGAQTAKELEDGTIGLKRRCYYSKSSYLKPPNLGVENTLRP